MGFVHRDKDSRSCGAKTIGTGNRVRVNGRIVAVNGDANTDGGGDLIASVTNVKIGGKPIIIQHNNAKKDNKCPIPGGDHCNPRARGASANVRAGG